MKKLTKEQIEYLQTHQEIKLEFDMLLNDDKDFNYNKDEFVEWLFDMEIFKGVK